MFKIVPTCILGSMLYAGTLYSQNQVDALRYSQSMPGTTARSNGVGGAFGAVGADLSSALINPAGLAFYRTKQFGMSAAFCNIKNNAMYNNKTTEDTRFNFNLPNVGYVSSNINYSNGKEVKQGWINVSYALTLNRTNTFQRQTLYEGNNGLSSITNSFAERANGQNPSDFYDGSIEKLAWDTRVIDADTIINTYTPNLRKRPYNVNQKGSILTRGAMNDYAFSVAGNYSHFFYFGGSLFLSSVRYIEDNNFKETDNYDASSKDMKSVSFTQYLKTSGTGVGVRLGAILKPDDHIRFGYSFQSPVSHSLKDEYSYKMESSFDPGASHVLGSGVSSESSGLQNYSYRILTPMKNTLSMAILDKNIGFISADVEFVNYRQSRLSASGDYDYLDENNYIKTNYRSVANVRAGAEIVAGIYRFRGGYAYYPSPYEDEVIAFNEKLYTRQLTFGFGIRDKSYALDFAWVNTKRSDYYAPYALNNPNDYYFVTNNVKATNVVITATFILE